MIDLVHSRLTHVGPIAHRMREADVIECRALSRTPKEGLRLGLRLSLHVFTVLSDGRPIAMLGVVPGSLLSGKGVPWFLGTDEVYREKRAWALLAPGVIDLFLRTFSHLENVVSVQNSPAIRFLSHMGFAVGGAIEEHGGVEFVPFRMDRPQVLAIQEAETAS